MTTTTFQPGAIALKFPALPTTAAEPSSTEYEKETLLLTGPKPEVKVMSNFTNFIEQN